MSNIPIKVSKSELKTPKLPRPAKHAPTQRSMQAQEVALIQSALFLSNSEMASLLGCSKVSFGRYRTGQGHEIARSVPAYVARLLLALEILNNYGLLEEFSKKAEPFLAIDFKKLL